ncbi:isochorismatase family protein [Falsiroseomonas sp. HC035]|uniref:isochorismatase family protein n=1 Tax=Falsiroseomonas sp. HC035 TaxID=3390999 RepID=UPI003D31CA5C
MTNPALRRMTPESAVIAYVDYVTGLDNLVTTIPGPVFRNNIQAFARFSPLFKLPTAVFGEENQYYGSFLPEIRTLIDAGAATFPRSTPSGCTPDFMAWLQAKGRRDVIIGGISIDNCTLHTALDLLRAGYNVQVVVDVSGSNSRLAEDAALARLQAAGSVNAGWLNTLTELGADFAGPFGAGMMQVIQRHWPASTTGQVQDTTPDGHGMQLPKT